MPTPTYDLIASTILAAPTSSVDFGSLPQTYRDLVLVVNVVGSASAGFYMQFNGDGGLNYSYVYILGTGSAVSADLQLSGPSEARFGNLTTGRGTHAVNIMDYSATDRQKIIFCRTGAVDGSGTVGTWSFVNRWASNSAITSIKIFPVGATMNSGATFSLYGIIS
jgi:hypothetical protein